ncbi:hypothetical protein [Candidatus Poriferisodalis sp.]|uniref:hypothetical protein n=1 Tax=Candidatus Poriferisodalis sp. TaxID=3101277 RepID=UPI003B01B0EE
MTRRGILLTDGPSDRPLAAHLEAMCLERGVRVDVSAPEFERLPNPPGLSVENRLESIRRGERLPDLLFVHRDAERQHPQLRLQEITDATQQVASGLPFVPIIPVRMTEAWLLADQQLIRQIAGRPDSTVDLGIPPSDRLERMPDPKAALRQALAAASGNSGRALKKFDNRFGTHRRLLLERLDRSGPVSQLPRWQALESDLDRVLASL